MHLTCGQIRHLVRATLFFVLVIVAAPARAQSSAVGGMWQTQSQSSKPGPSRVSRSKTADSTSQSPADSVVRAPDASVEHAIRAQADTIAALRARLAAMARDSAEALRSASVTRPASHPATPDSATPDSATPVSVPLQLVSRRIDSLAAAQRTLAQQQAATDRAVAQRLSGIGNFRFSGDVRVRYEGQFQGGGFVTRHRERSRARLGITGNLSDALTGGIAIATGPLDDVQSSNQTQTGFFSRKSIGFDRFYVQWKPKTAARFGVIAGKFTYPWERTSLTFGNDINPEGVAPSVATGTHGRLTSATLVAFALPLLEVSSDKDSYVTGAQVQTRWRLAEHASARASLALVNVDGADAILSAVTVGTIKPSSATTNTTRTDSAGKIVGFATGFRYVDAIAGVEVTPTPRWPVTALINVVQNQAAVVGQRTGLFADVRAGRLSQPNDWQAGWSLFRIERDAVVGALNEQDLRAATNVLNHRATFAYQWRSNASLGFGLWLGRLLAPAETGKLATPQFRAACTDAPSDACRDPWLKRLQIDLSYKY